MAPRPAHLMAENAARSQDQSVVDQPHHRWILSAVEDYIASFHSRSSLSYDRMPPDDAAAFDRQLHELVAPWGRNGMLDLQIAGSVVWGHSQEPVRAQSS